MAIDLSTCVPGQKVCLRNGTTATYIGTVRYAYQVDDHTYTVKGEYCLSAQGPFDVVEILPLETTESTKNDKHPSVAWWESCPWITDRPPTKEDGSNIDEYVLAKTSIRELPFLVNWASVPVTAAWVHLWNWQPVTLTNKEQALELLNKHEDGWRPTPEQWNIIRKGLKE